MTEVKLTTFKLFNENGEEVPFAEHVRELGPDIYQKDFENVIKSWRHADWIYTDEFIAPLVSQILTDACELDPEMYAKIMVVIEEAFDKFQPIINPYHLTIVK